MAQIKDKVFSTYERLKVLIMKTLAKLNTKMNLINLHIDKHELADVLYGFESLSSTKLVHQYKLNHIQDKY